MNRISIRATNSTRGPTNEFVGAGLCDHCTARIVAFTTVIVGECTYCVLMVEHNMEGSITITRYRENSGIDSALGIRSPKGRVQGTYGVLRTWQAVCQVCRTRVQEEIRVMWDGARKR